MNFGSELFSDCVIILDRTYHAHKSILYLSNEWFKAKILNNSDNKLNLLAENDKDIFKSSDSKYIIWCINQLYVEMGCQIPNGHNLFLNDNLYDCLKYIDYFGMKVDKLYNILSTQNIIKLNNIIYNVGKHNSVEEPNEDEIINNKFKFYEDLFNNIIHDGEAEYNYLTKETSENDKQYIDYINLFNHDDLIKELQLRYNESFFDSDICDLVDQIYNANPQLLHQIDNFRTYQYDDEDVEEDGNQRSNLQKNNNFVNIKEYLNEKHDLDFIGIVNFISDIIYDISKFYTNKYTLITMLKMFNANSFTCKNTCGFKFVKEKFMNIKISKMDYRYVFCFINKSLKVPKTIVIEVSSGSTFKDLKFKPEDPQYNILSIYIIHIYYPYILSIYIIHIYYPYILSIYIIHIYYPYILSIYIIHIYYPYILSIYIIHIYYPYILSIYIIHIYYPYILSIYIIHIYYPYILSIYIIHIYYPYMNCFTLYVSCSRELVRGCNWSNY